MDRKFQPHTSSLGGLQANVIVLIIWLAPAILGIFLPNVSYLGLIIPVVFLLIEKESALVRNHAGQALALYLITNAIQIVLGIVVSVLALGGAVVTAATPGGSGAGIYTVMASAGIGGLFILAVAIFSFVFAIIACVRGWKWENYTLPIVGRFGKWLTKTIKIN